ncbi:dihydrofolate reductase [Salirhabdus euzebyi]|uniref:Dihydrofolate reductase n=1 Tax=Salirhabdus euzebyi TaxID=394506 RepID=A0A841Q358_9BACI|nr:dihydrofolate reductase family protein [Salirhabdus euzebyi]MBB6452658.1 dihydrofolate reductase [Salirhabdus euzebyi]
MNSPRKLKLFIAMSLDGYIATEDDSLDWLFSVDGEGDNGYSEFYETVDTILIGKRTYDWIIEHEKGHFPYKNKECYVFTRSKAVDTDDVTFIGDNIVSFTTALKNQKGGTIWVVGGGDLLHSFLKEKLIDEMMITIAPKLIGSGIPLFKRAEYQLDFTLKGTRTFNQFVELHYTLKND